MVAIGIILIIAAVFLTIAVLMQHGKSHNLSGTIAGASETFFGKSKATTIDRKLSILTTVVAVVFVVLVLVAYLIQGAGTGSTSADGGINMAPTTTEAEATDDITADSAATDAPEASETPAVETPEASETPAVETPEAVDTPAAE